MAISPGPSSRTAANDLPEDLGAGRAILLFGLPPGGVCRAGPVARAAVSSYLAVSPLPSPANRPSGGLFSVALSLSLRTVGVTHHLALRSPDFPPAANAAGGHPETRPPDTTQTAPRRHGLVRNLRCGGAAMGHRAHIADLPSGRMGFDFPPAACPSCVGQYSVKTLALAVLAAQSRHPLLRTSEVARATRPMPRCLLAALRPRRRSAAVPSGAY